MIHCLVLLVLLPLETTQPSTYQLADVHLLVGSWQNVPGQKTRFEETWSEPTAGGMIGMFRVYQGDKLSLYEFLLIEQEADGVYMRLRHYRPKMIDMDKEPLRLKLHEASDKKLIFVNTAANADPKRILYELDDAGFLTATVETSRNGKPVQFTLKMQRVKK